MPKQQQPEHIKDLTPDLRNARRHTPRNVGMIEDALHEVGAARSIVIDEAGVVLAGNATLEAAGAAGITRVQVVDADGQTIVAVRRKGLTARQKQRLALFDNRTAELAEWDEAQIEAMLKDDPKITEGMFRDDEVAEMLANAGDAGDPGDAEPQIDKAAELNKAWQVKPGDLWAIGGHRLLCGDSTKTEDVARVMGGAQPVLMVTDPPYGVEYCPEWRIGAKAKGKVTNDDRAGWSAAYGLSRVSVAYVWHAGIYATTVHRGLEAAGFELRAQIVWVKSRVPMSRGHYHWAHEPCWYAVRKGESGSWAGSRKQKTVWGNIIDGFSEKDEPMFAARLDAETVFAFPASATTVWEIKQDAACEGGHSTQKPQECMARPMRNHNAPEVYDPFLGSGTTMVAAQNLGRKCYGIEISPAYCAVILQRMTDAFPGIKIGKAK